MKRFLPLAVLFFMLLAGYTYFANSTGPTGARADAAEDQGHSREVTETGVITSLGNIFVTGSGTHLFTKSDRSTILLVGLGANLDNYLEKPVTIEGLLTETPSGKKLIQVLHVSSSRYSQPLDTDSSSIRRTEWTKYEHSDFGVTFQRRDFWLLTESASKLIFAITSEEKSDCHDEACTQLRDDLITVERILNTKNAKLQTFTGNEKMSSKNLIGPHKLIGYRYVDRSKGMITFVVSREKFVFVIRYTPGVVKPFDLSANDFYTLMSTFDFVPIVPAKT